MTKTQRTDITPNRIREVRRAKGWTLAELGDAVGLSFSAVGKLERSERTLSLDMLDAMARALEVPPADLIGRTLSRIETARIPLIETLVAGDWTSAIRHPLAHIVVPSRGAEGKFAILPDGDMTSFMGTMGVIFVVDTVDARLRDDKVYAFVDPEGRTIFKRYRANPAQLESIGPNHKAEPIPVGRGHYEVIGRVTHTLEEF